MLVLGVSFGYHDSAATLLRDGKVLAAVAEERFTRQKHDPNYPYYSIKHCLERSGASVDDLDLVVFHEDPHLKFSRVLSSSLSAFPFSRLEFIDSVKSWLGKKLWTIGHLAKSLDIAPEKIKYLNHHFAHASAAFLGSGLKSAAILVTDAVGEWSSTALYKGNWTDSGPKIEKLKEVNFPHSLGLVYSALTAYLGFNPNDSECSTMALAGFGRPVFLEDFKQIVRPQDDGSYRVDQSYFNFTKFYREAWTKKFTQKFGPPRSSSAPLPFDCLVKNDENAVPKEAQRFADIAASVQALYEEQLIKMANSLYELCPTPYLCLGGGAALNCVANTKILKKTPFKNLYIPPDPGDGGSSLGAALYGHYSTKVNHSSLSLKAPYWGEKHSEKQIFEMISHLNTVGDNKRLAQTLYGPGEAPRFSLECQIIEDENKLVQVVAQEIYNQKIVGWYQGGAEFGPRALGNRSILIRPDLPELATRLSKEVKTRSSFRPYALSMHKDEAKRVLEISDLDLTPLRMMQLAVKVQDQVAPRVRAGLHIDQTTRPHVCFEEDNPRFYKLLENYGRLSGLGVLINTSFNESGYPIVASPVMATISFVRTNMDVLVINNLVIKKNYEQK